MEKRGGIGQSVVPRTGAPEEVSISARAQVPVCVCVLCRRNKKREWDTHTTFSIAIHSQGYVNLHSWENVENSKLSGPLSRWKLLRVVYVYTEENRHTLHREVSRSFCSPSPSIFSVREPCRAKCLFQKKYEYTRRVENLLVKLFLAWLGCFPPLYSPSSSLGILTFSRIVRPNIPGISRCIQLTLPRGFLDYHLHS